MATYFISDIHLHAGSKFQAKLLLDFLQTHGSKADALYIIGDLFAIWLGDDLNEPYSQELSKALRNISEQNVPLYFMRGNRDFLVGNKFCQQSGAILLNDPCTINLYGQQVLLTHGDQLCTLDQSYQKFRKLVQHQLVRTIFLALPIFLRRKLGTWVKQKTRGSPKNPASYDVEQKTVNAWFAQHNVKTMIHGHTHRPAIHTHADTTRIVLGDWEPGSAKILSFTPQGYELIEMVTVRT